MLQAHKDVKHLRVKSTLAEIRQNFWICRGRNFVRKILPSYTTCRKIKGKHYDYPPTPTLTSLRLNHVRAFYCTGIDNFGPVHLKNIYPTDNRLHKAWVTLYTCAASRGVLLDLVPDPSSQLFIRSLIRFISRRGCPDHVISDNGKNFVAKDSQTFTSHRNIKWHFNLPLAPWHGEFFERMVHTVKSILKKELKNSRLNYEQMQTVLYEVERIVNNRPLTHTYPDNIETCVTPNHLLYGRRLEQKSLNSNNLDSFKDIDIVVYSKEVEGVLSHFWNRWRTEYLSELREQHKIEAKNMNVVAKVGDVVIIHEDYVPRSVWRLGVIVELIRSKDGLVRGARVRVGKTGTVVSRPVTKLYPVEYYRLKDDDATKGDDVDNNDDELTIDNHDNVKIGDKDDVYTDNKDVKISNHDGDDQLYKYELENETIRYASNDANPRPRRSAGIMGELKRIWNVEQPQH